MAAAAAPASAQESGGKKDSSGKKPGRLTTILRSAFASINFGGQTGSAEISQSGTFPIYGEEASFQGASKVNPSGFFHLGGGVRVWRRLGVGLFYSRTSDSADASITATVPNPAIINVTRSASTTVGGLDHSQSAVHLQFMWTQPIMRRIDVTGFVGPSFFSVKQDVAQGLTAANVSEAGPFPFSTVSLSSNGAVSAKDSPGGFNIGFDATYRLTRHLGAGLLLHYTAADARLPIEGRTISMDVGGLQVGAGIRWKF
jgi:hypothetical protein